MRVFDLFKKTGRGFCFFALALIACASPASSFAAQAVKLPGVCFNQGGVGNVAWNSAYAAQTLDNQKAFAPFPAGPFNPVGVSNYLVCNSFGFAIPLGSVITGIYVESKRSADFNVYDNDVKIVKNGTLVGQNRANASLYPLYDIPQPYGGVTDLWGQTWVPADINASNFGIAISARGSGYLWTAGMAKIDVVSITVYYNPSEPTLGGFNVIDGSLSSSSAVTGRIYTKLAGTAFNLKVAALNATKTATETAYAISGNKTVTLDLFDDSAGSSCNASASACSSCSKPKIVTSQTLSFSGTDAGFKTSATITVPNAYQRILARASEGSTTACSADVFAVRPSAFTSLSSSASNTALTGVPVFKAGTDSFGVTVGTAVAGYRGTAKINPAAMAANAATWVLGSLSSTTFPAATTSGSNSTASGNFYYNEAGHFKFLGTASTGGNSAGIYDDTWTAVDQTSDCIANSLTNTLSSDGKYGCGFGLAADSALLGRFVPDHFKITASSLTPANTSFVYMGQAGLGLAYSVEARSGNNVGNSTPNSVTQNYSQGRVPVVNPSLVAEDQPSSNQSCNLGTRISGLPSTSWSNGKYTLPSTNTTFSRPANTSTALNASSAANCNATKDAAAGPFDFLDMGLQIADPDTTLLGSDLNMRADTSGACTSPTGGASNAATNCNAQKLGSTAVRFGRIKISDTTGPATLDLDVPIEAQYWTGVAFATQTADNATAVTPPNKTTLASGANPNGVPNLYFYTSNPLVATSTTPTVQTSVNGTLFFNQLKSGKTNLHLTPPNASTSAAMVGQGFLDVLLSVPSYLTGSWLNCLGQTGAVGLWDDLPCARVTYASLARKSTVIMRRENF